jgi:ferredoxin--NADP+ reductase
MRVAVVGSGPAGIYVADELVRRSDLDVAVDILERLPVPYGLVRYGVAPDHPRIKAIIGSLQRILEHPQVRFLGSVDVGRDVTRRQLAESYDGVVYATGAPRTARLGVEGDRLRGCVPAVDIVSWYSGHPDATRVPALSTHAVGIIGAGNVALDVARILAKRAEHLDPTDMPRDVLDALHVSQVTDIHLFCRRGPEYARFTAKELRELTELDDVDIVIDTSALEAVDDTALDRATASNIAVFRELARHRISRPRRRLSVHFWARPTAVLGDTEVTGLRVDRVALDENGVLRGTGHHSTWDLGLVVAAIGNRGVGLEGLPFDEDSGTVPNEHGRVMSADGRPVERTYIAGWAKRGASGVVGTNRADAADTVRALVKDLRDAPASASPPSSPVLPAAATDYDGWLRIDAEEIGRGRAAGKARTKVADWATLRRLSAIESTREEMGSTS